MIFSFIKSSGLLTGIPTKKTTIFPSLHHYRSQANFCDPHLIVISKIVWVCVHVCAVAFHSIQLISRRKCNIHRMSVRLEYVIHLFILLMSFGQYLFSCVSVSISFVVSFNYDHIQMPLNSIYKLKYVPAQLLIYGRGGKLKCIFRSNI